MCIYDVMVMNEHLIGDYWDVGYGWVQELIHGNEVEEGAQIHSLQDRWEVKACHRW